MSEVLVVKLGGTTIEEQQGVLAEIALVARSRPVVVVHGGGRRLTDWLDRLGVPTRFEAGRRVTDDAAIEVASAVLGGVVNGELVAALLGHGANAVGLTGVDGGFLRGERVPGLGRVARVVAVNHDLLDALLVAGRVPVVAPLVRDETGVVCNVNADEAAAGLAADIGARQTVLLTDVPAVLDATRRPIRTLAADAARELIADGTIAGGMIPKVEAALEALGRSPVPDAEVVIADGRAPDALLRALGDRAFGTRVTAGTDPVSRVGVRTRPGRVA
ncbi:MAG TPA: acetylglutamate kinase [Candidatus Limnocylindrales bacterium]|nr:acetylglutamate kinase [Candidatus Limnocylindrales bacterium]